MRNERAWRLRYGLLGAGCALALAAAAIGGLAAGPGAAAPKVTVVKVAEREYSLTPSVRKLPAAGRVTFVVANRGKLTHGLAIGGPGLARRQVFVRSGQTKRLTVTLRAGSYRIWCPVPGHAALGMRTTLRVGAGSIAAAPAAAPAPAPTTTAPAASGGGEAGGWG